MNALSKCYKAFFISVVVLFSCLVGPVATAEQRQTVEVLGLMFSVPSALKKEAEAMSPDGKTQGLMFVNKLAGDVSAVLRLKVLTRKPDFNLAREIEKVMKEWSLQGVRIGSTPKLLSEAQIGSGVHFLQAENDKLKKPLTLMISVREVQQKLVILSLLGPTQEQMPAIFKQNKSWFETVKNSPQSELR